VDVFGNTVTSDPFQSFSYAKLGVLCRYMSCPGKEHFVAAKQVIQSTVALSTAEAETIAGLEAVK
jgi:hypothetical protein